MREDLVIKGIFMNTYSLFTELLELVKITRPEYICGLGQGYSRLEIESAIEIHPIPESLVTVYSCVGGDYSEIDGFSGLIPAYDLIQLNAINRLISMFQSSRFRIINQPGEDVSNMSWEPDMIPFLHDGAGYYVCVRTLVDDHSIWVLPKALNRHKINTSLDHFILTAIECYRQGAYYLDEDDEIWDTDEVLYREIVRSIDPEIENYFPP